MSATVPVQEFQIGQRVQQGSGTPFTVIWVRVVNNAHEYSGYGHGWHLQGDLTLTPGPVGAEYEA